MVRADHPPQHGGQSARFGLGERGDVASDGEGRPLARDQQGPQIVTGGTPQRDFVQLVRRGLVQRVPGLGTVQAKLADTIGHGELDGLEVSGSKRFGPPPAVRELFEPRDPVVGEGKDVDELGVEQATAARLALVPAPDHQPAVVEECELAGNGAGGVASPDPPPEVTPHLGGPVVVPTEPQRQPFGCMPLESGVQQPVQPVAVACGQCPVQLGCQFLRSRAIHGPTSASSRTHSRI